LQISLAFWFDFVITSDISWPLKKIVRSKMADPRWQVKWRHWRYRTSKPTRIVYRHTAIAIESDDNSKTLPRQYFILLWTPYLHFISSQVSFCSYRDFFFLLLHTFYRIYFKDCAFYSLFAKDCIQTIECSISKTILTRGSFKF